MSDGIIKRSFCNVFTFKIIVYPFYRIEQPSCGIIGCHPRNVPFCCSSVWFVNGPPYVAIVIESRVCPACNTAKVRDARDCRVKWMGAMCAVIRHVQTIDAPIDQIVIIWIQFVSLWAIIIGATQFQCFHTALEICAFKGVMKFKFPFWKYCINAPLLPT